MREIEITSSNEVAAETSAVDELTALLGRTFTYSTPSIYVTEDIVGDTFKIGNVRFSTKILAEIILAQGWRK
jgi:hypothetical protein